MKTCRTGTTLLEVVIGLAIFCTLTTISLYNIKDFQARVEEKQSLEWFKNTFKTAFNRAYLTGQESKFIIEENNTIIFDMRGNYKKTKQIKRKLPSSLSFYENSRNEYKIYGSGEASPVTITVNSTLTHRKYIYKIQMGWGEIIDETA
ncbi:hypothetical protein [Companilactobacillus zhachilii]|uniref:hypothetical protein n=1 Tax=Companilactobacillus zhachilii TaxID=2304606 RepID=UPI00403466C3